MPLWPASLRARLTLWSALVVGAPLVAVGVGSYQIFSRTLLSRTDRFVSEALTAFSRELAAERRTTASVQAAAVKTVSEVRFRELQVAVLDAQGAVLASSSDADEATPGPDASALSTRAMLRAASSSSDAAVTIREAAVGYRVVARPYALDGSALRIVAAYPLRDVDEVLSRIRRAFLLGVPLLLVVVAAGGYFLARRSLAPVADMAERASHMSASTLHDRLPVPTSDAELGGLASVINGLLNQLEAAFQQQRRFMADASHELRTPTAILRTEADVTLSRATRPETEYRSAVTVMQDAARRLTRIVDDLFLLARVDAGPILAREENLYLEDVVHDAVRAIQQIADQRGVSVELAETTDAPMRGDPDLLGRLVLNLLDNAVKHAPSGSTVLVDLRSSGTVHHLRVTDEGPGIPADARTHVFERFFRLDTARVHEGSSASAGAGLGLAIARHIAEAHRGRLVLVSSEPGRTVFDATLPSAST